jgi:CAAX prenyl protease-like protein
MVADIEDQSLASGLSSLSPFIRTAWLLFRVALVVIAVSIAEELAFRGFLIRRLVQRDFASLNPTAYTVPAVLISSLLFGPLHETRWLAGTVAGLIYAVAFLRRGRIGGAAIAHATSNAWLALWVLWSGNWSLWLHAIVGATCHHHFLGPKTRSLGKRGGSAYSV